jgi:hypothetical protein
MRFACNKEQVTKRGYKSYCDTANKSTYLVPVENCKHEQKIEYTR